MCNDPVEGSWLFAFRLINAARNLARLAASSAVSACGVERAGPIRKNRVKRSKSRKKALCSQRPPNVRPEKSSEFSERPILTVTIAAPQRKMGGETLRGPTIIFAARIPSA